MTALTDEKPTELSASAGREAGLSLTEAQTGRVQKIFNFSPDLAHRLRDEAARRSRETGTRVTEKWIVVEALEARLAAQG